MHGRLLAAIGAISPAAPLSSRPHARSDFPIARARPARVKLSYRTPNDGSCRGGRRRGKARCAASRTPRSGAAARAKAAWTPASHNNARRGGDQAPVLFDSNGAARTITLNRPRALNALNLDMVHLIDAQLAAWDTEEGAKVSAAAAAGS